MPQKVTLADGSEKEVYMPEEVEAMKATAAKAEADLKSGLEKAQKDLADAATKQNPNWAEARPKVDAYNAMLPQLQEKGFKVDDKGNITFPEVKPSMTPEEVSALVDKRSDEKFFGRYIDTKLGKYTDEQKDQIKGIYGKLTTGETLASTDDVDRHLNQAIQAIVPQAPSADPRFMRAQGLPPAPHQPVAPLGAPEGFQSNGFAESEAGKAMANEIFEGESFAKEPKK